LNRRELNGIVMLKVKSNRFFYENFSKSDHSDPESMCPRRCERRTSYFGIYFLEGS
jgi:hypothetical protein